MNDHIYTAALLETWAIVPGALEILVTQARNGADPMPNKLPRVDGDIAVIPIYGPISQRDSLFSSLFGGSSTDAIGAAFSRAMANNRVGGVIFDVDSPGGTIGGVQALSDAIYASRGWKPSVAVANSQAASAAYWLASSAGTLAAAPGADVGSIGVFRMHQDASEMMAMEGVKTTFIATPEHKVEGNPYEPLGDGALAHHQQQVDDAYEGFIKTAARNRGIQLDEAHEGFGKGRTFNAGEAKSRGMVDRIATIGKVAKEMGLGAKKRQITAAESQEIEKDLCEAWASGESVSFGPVPVSVRERELKLTIRDK